MQFRSGLKVAFALAVFLVHHACGRAAELLVRVEPRWGETALAVPSGELPTSTGQRVRITRLAALLTEFRLLKADGGSVRLEGQAGFLDAAGGRLEIALREVPAGTYTGLQFCVGVPPAANHASPERWPAEHALNPRVNGLHWSWQGGYVFAAVEGFWRDDAAPLATAEGFSYHLATDAALMTIGFAAQFEVSAVATRLDLAWNVEKLFVDCRISAVDGSDGTHSAANDSLAPQLVRAVERGWFWLDATPLPASAVHANRAPATTAVSTTAAVGKALATIAGAREKSAAPSAGTPVAFTVPAGFPQPQLPADNPLTREGVELGRHLFFDPRLSRGGEQSCVSCHDPRRAFSDRVALSRGVDGLEGTRNAMPLVNLAWHPAYAWDGSKKTIREQSLAAMTNPVEMAASIDAVVAELADDPRVRRDFAAAFGSEEISGARIGLALEQFLFVQVSADSKFDRALRGEGKLTAQEQRGFELFSTEYDPARGKRGGDCFHCHGGALFGDFASRSNGLDLQATDAGAQLATGRAEDRGRFKTPSLRNVALTAPYMHDGRFRTLEDVVAHYDHGVQRATNLDPNLAKHPRAGLGLPAEDQSALVAFLRTLTGVDFARPPHPPDSPPPERDRAAGQADR